MKIGFDNDKYLQMQSAHIKERISQFDNKLYLEFGGNYLTIITLPVYCLDFNLTVSSVCWTSFPIRQKLSS